MSFAAVRFQMRSRRRSCMMGHSRAGVGTAGPASARPGR